MCRRVALCNRGSAVVEVSLHSLLYSACQAPALEQIVERLAFALIGVEDDHLNRGLHQTEGRLGSGIKTLRYVGKECGSHPIQHVLGGEQVAVQIR